MTLSRILLIEFDSIKKLFYEVILLHSNFVFNFFNFDGK